MKLQALNILLNDNFIPNKKFYFISGNEHTLMEKIGDLITRWYKDNEKATIKNLNSINDFVDEAELFENKSIYVIKNCKGLDEKSLEKIRHTSGSFVFIQENSQKLKKLKNYFINDKDSYLVDCYELDRSSKIKILNRFINISKIKINQDIYWILIDKLDNKYIFFENCLNKILELNPKDITIENIKKILTIDDSGKEKIFFNLLKKNKDIVELYKDKIITISDVNDLYYYSRFHCQLIIDSENENQYNKKIPIYLFREKNYLMDIYRKYNSRKKKLLLKLLLSTEHILRKQSSLSLAVGMRFILNIKKITIS
tara:strand:- start:491 stop:1429 length:939 start_codon:yes stop_codon:yes gene_type:complete